MTNNSLANEIRDTFKKIRSALEKAPSVQRYFLTQQKKPDDDGTYLSMALLHLLNNIVFSEKVDTTSNVSAFEMINTHFKSTFGDEVTPDYLRRLSNKAQSLSVQVDIQPAGSVNSDLAYIKNVANFMNNLVVYLDFIPSDKEQQGMMFRRMNDGIEGKDGRNNELKLNPKDTLPTKLLFYDRARSMHPSEMESWWNQ